MFLGRIAVAKGILVPNMNFARPGMRELLSFFFVAMVKMFTISMVIEMVLSTWLFSHLIFVANINFVQLQMNELLRLFPVAMETMFTIAMM